MFPWERKNKRNAFVATTWKFTSHTWTLYVWLTCCIFIHNNGGIWYYSQVALKHMKHGTLLVPCFKSMFQGWFKFLSFESKLWGATWVVETWCPPFPQVCKTQFLIFSILICLIIVFHFGFICLLFCFLVSLVDFSCWLCYLLVVLLVSFILFS
jgi:hypothetical protein